MHTAGPGAKPSVIDTGKFRLQAMIYGAGECRGKDMRLYIEGDGLSWLSRQHISPDPTPLNPLAARLFSQDPVRCKAYLARPCQYISSPKCSPRYWTDARFAPEIIRSYQSALNRLKQRLGNRKFILIGYSGGGAVAALLAAKRRDVSGLVTIAGNLDTSAWTRLHHLAPLNASLNPADSAVSLAGVPQIHLIGGSDRVIPAEVANSYISHFPTSARQKIRTVVIENADHRKGWERIWKQFIKGYRP